MNQIGSWAIAQIAVALVIARAVVVWAYGTVATQPAGVVVVTDDVIFVMERVRNHPKMKYHLTTNNQKNKAPGAAQF